MSKGIIYFWFLSRDVILLTGSVAGDLLFCFFLFLGGR